MTLVRIKKRKQVIFDAETEVPTVPVVEDPTSPHWIHTDILKGELAVNLRSNRVWTRTDFGIIEIGTSYTSQSYIGPLTVSGGNSYQNDLLIDVPDERIIVFVNEIRYPLLGDSAKATFDSPSGTITLISGLTFNPNSDIFILIKP
mgnify:CR=1 FL=1